MLHIKCIILIILIVILSIIYYCKKTNKGNHLSLGESQTIFNDTNYINNFSQLDRKLRKCGEDNEECRTNYKNSVLEFSKLEQEMLVKIVSDFTQLLGSNFSDIFSQIRFIKVKNNIENSMPHTRNQAIVFSQGYFKSLLDKYEGNNNFLENDIHLIKLIAHEQFHIYQRYHSKIIEQFYRTQWNLVKLDIPLPPKIKEINRTNPDALPNNNWLFPIGKNKYILPLCVYNSLNSESINDTSNIYVTLIRKKNKFHFPELEKQLAKKNLLSNQKNFTDFFGYQGANNYHPHEISASLFEDIVLGYINKGGDIDTKKEHSQAYNLLKRFLI